MFIFTANFLMPIYSFALFFLYERTPQSFVAALFVSALLIERAYETFKTSQEKKREEFHGDWTLAALTGAYLALVFLSVTEYFFVMKHLNLLAFITGVLLLAGSFRMRFWGMAALGKQWAIHAVGAQKIKQVRLIKIGPYKYVRHPIYAGIILEVLSVPFILNSPRSFWFSLLVCVPLVVIRALVEEKTSVRRLGEEYLQYKKEVPMLLPLKAFSKTK